MKPMQRLPVRVPYSLVRLRVRIVAPADRANHLVVRLQDRTAVRIRIRTVVQIHPLIAALGGRGHPMGHIAEPPPSPQAALVARAAIPAGMALTINEFSVKKKFIRRDELFFYELADREDHSPNS
ncbi:hypothetical protein GCM10027185_41840 [Spirosoma pulveris]